MKSIELLQPAAPVAAVPPANPLAARLADLFGRVAPATIFLLIATPKISALIHFARTQGTESAAIGQLHFYAAIGARLSVILFVGLMVVLFVVRTPPVQKARGLFPRITAIVGTFLMSIITIFPRADLGPGLLIAATLLVLSGTLLSIYVLARLGRSFSVMAEARRLVTSGPYARVRHPLYLAEQIALLGTAIQFFSWFTVLIFFLHLLVQIQRMKNEEAVLQGVYPEYGAYRARTARLIPRLY